jgi:hypothetical protein
MEEWREMSEGSVEQDARKAGPVVLMDYKQKSSLISGNRSISS